VSRGPFRSSCRRARTPRRALARRALPAATALLLASLLLTGPGAAPALATPHAATAARSVSPQLAGVAVDSVEFRLARARVDQVAASLAAAQNLEATSAAELAQLRQRDAELTSTLAALTVAKKQAAVDLASARGALRALAVSSYVRGAGSEGEPLDDLDVATHLDAVQGLTGAVSTGQAAKAGAARATLDRVTHEMDSVLTQRTEVRQRVATVEATHDQAVADVATFTASLAQAQSVLERARAMAKVVGEDFQLVALDAYVRAASATARSNPSCGIPWWALAGITRIESRHGTFGGARLLDDGDTSKSIVGIPLDGANQTEAIPDTDGGELDGDPAYDRAVGPMQFIPATWRAYGRDGNGDGRADPNNIYDAALAAARYLCAGGPMQTDEEMARGFYRYNHSVSYAAAVLQFAKLYSTFAIPPV